MSTNDSDAHSYAFEAEAVALSKVRSALNEALAAVTAARDDVTGDRRETVSGVMIDLIHILDGVEAEIEATEGQAQAAERG